MFVGAVSSERSCRLLGDVVMSDIPPDNRYEALQRAVFGAVPDPELRRLAGEVRESRLLGGHLLYDPEVTVVTVGLVRAFIGDGNGRQVTIGYLRPGRTLGLAHLAGRRYPVAFQAIENSRLLVIGNERALQLHSAYPALGWATVRELSAYFNDLEIELASHAFGSLRQRLASHLLALTVGDGTDQPVHLGLLVTAVGSSREVISRTLGRLAADGTLHIDTFGAQSQAEVSDDSR